MSSRNIYLYYETVPGVKLLENERRNYNIELNDWAEPNAAFGKPVFNFGHILNGLGFNVLWTKDPEQGVVFVDVDSSSIHVMDQIADIASKKFKKFILSSLTEPRIVQLTESKLLDKYPNMLYLDICYPISEASIATRHPRHCGFPVFIPRVLSMACNYVKMHPAVNLREPLKGNMFNHLSFNWRKEKFVLHYFLMKNGIEDIVFSFKHLSKDRYPVERDGILNHLARSELLTVEEKQDILKEINPATSMFSDISLNNDTPFSVHLRQHPRWLYDESYVSLIAESNHDDESGFITEKILQPMLNQHPVIILGSCGNFNSALQRLGFAIHDELIDFSFDQHRSLMDRGKVLVNQIKDLNKEKYFENINTVTEKVHHNFNLLMNKRSVLYDILYDRMDEIINRYYEL